MVDNFASRPTAKTTPVSVVTKKGFAAWRKQQAKAVLKWLDATDFAPDAGKVALLPGRDGSLSKVVVGLGSRPDLWAFATLAGALPNRGRFAYDETLTAALADRAALAWALSTYQFTRYKKAPRRFATLVWPKDADRAEVTRLADGIKLGRDLINTPAQDLGPPELVEAVRTLGTQHGAKVTVIKGNALHKGYPAVHAVGRAASRPPELADLRWGDPKAPKVTLVGKGVCFDSGGLDIKPASGMRYMKKDMGGAASVLALAHAIMDAGLPVRLRVLIPAVENSISADAYRPGDVLATRKGLTVEIGNTDAEGRLILCDALAEADSEDPEILIDFATLTGAARVALGTDLPALFCNDDALVGEILAAGIEADDPLWRMPLHRDYRRQLDSRIADLSNVGNVATGGAITAALFLQRFVGPKRRWAHVDTMGWNTSTRAGRPSGGEIFGVRAFYRALARRFSSK